MSTTLVSLKSDECGHDARERASSTPVSGGCVASPVDGPSCPLPAYAVVFFDFGEAATNLQDGGPMSRHRHTSRSRVGRIYACRYATLFAGSVRSRRTVTSASLAVSPS